MFPIKYPLVASLLKNQLTVFLLCASIQSPNTEKSVTKSRVHCTSMQYYWGLCNTCGAPRGSWDLDGKIRSNSL